MRRTLPSILVSILFLLACQTSEEEKIHQTLKQRQEALQKKDLSLYLSTISKDYRDKDEDFGRVKDRVAGYFNAFDRIEYSSWDRSVHIEGDHARVIQQFHMEVEEGKRKNRYSGKESLFLKREGREWKIIQGL